MVGIIFHQDQNTTFLQSYIQRSEYSLRDWNLVSIGQQLYEVSRHQNRALPGWAEFSKNIHAHIVGRVLSFFSSRCNWDSPNPSPAGECAPPPLVPGGGAHLLTREGGGRVSIQTRGHTLWYSVYICTLCPRLTL